MRQFINEAAEAVDITYTDENEEVAVYHVGSGGAVQFDETDPRGEALANHFATTTLTEVI